MNETTIKFAPGRALEKKQAPSHQFPREPHLWLQAAGLLKNLAAYCERKNQDRIKRLTQRNLEMLKRKKRRDLIDL